eukprot:2988568-Alexandrium_andersonii.AAC.1
MVICGSSGSTFGCHRHELRALALLGRCSRHSAAYERPRSRCSAVGGIGGGMGMLACTRGARCVALPRL